MNRKGIISGEWLMTDQEFDHLRKLVHRTSGIVVGADKRNLIRARLQRRLASLQLRSLSDYLELINTSGGHDEQALLISLLTTNVTSFFRESAHFTLLNDTILPSLHNLQEPVQIWSAGCSSGQEPYSAAISIADHHPLLQRNCAILASDIDLAILDTARAAIYRDQDLNGLDPDQITRHFLPVTDPGTAANGKWRLDPKVASLVEFQQLNLNAHWSIHQRFHVIFCRNVAIYFSIQDQRRLWGKFAAALHPGGWLLIGHAERVPADLHHLLQPSGITAYQRPS
ncbi:MAG: CheR family methyltransferase [Paracoccus sp. (in: a-proteobacteria)]